MRKRIVLLVGWMLAIGLAHGDSAKDILEISGVRGGLLIQVGCGDGQLISALGANDGWIVQGLDASAANVEKAKSAIQANGLLGKVTARTFDGKNLPYIDNTVNLLVVSDEKSAISGEEMARVLAPLGVVLTKKETRIQIPGFARNVSGDWVAWRKPWPKEIDEWTHYQYNPQGTMVGNDQTVGPPRRIQWVGDPKWLRNHDFMSSMHVLVSAGGRIFYIIDEGLRNHIFLPSRWTLIARDGFNGAILWKKPLKNWHPNNWPLKSGPGDLPRRMVAVGDKVYVTLGINEPLTALDAATGQEIRTYEGTKSTEEILVSEGVLYLTVAPGRQPVNFKAEATTYNEIARANNGWAWTPESPIRRVMAIEATSGKVLWDQEARVAPLSLTVGDEQVFFHNSKGVVALDRKSGDNQWASDGPAIKSVPTGSTLRMVYYDGSVAFSQGTKLAVFDAKKGDPLWTGSLQKTSHHCPEDLFIIDGLIWSPNTGRPQEKGTHFKVMDLRTGDIKKDFVAENIKGFPMHPRCYPSRATTKYIMTNGMGTEFYKVGGTTVDVNNVVRGSCIYGIMPSNGLLYKPPDSCACFYQSKLEHFCALAPAGATESAPVGERLEKGPAYGAIKKGAPKSTAWPMYRRDSSRSGYAPAPVSTDLEKKWNVQLGGNLTQPVVAYGKVFISAIDRQTLHALDIATGQEAWKHIAGGRIDSSPTLYENTVIFGCADGWVYCLRASDGALAWRYLVAPEKRQIVSREQLESVWPVHGAVLIENDILYVLAGRNMFFDGGLRLARLDPSTGKELSATMLDENDPRTGENLQTLISAKYMPVAKQDILSSDGKRFYMLEQNFDMEGNRIQIAPTLPNARRGEATPSEERGGKHLFSQTGLLDNVWFHRSYWIYGDNCGEGWAAYPGTRNVAPSGRIMAIGEKKAYAFRATPLGNMLHPRTTYHLYAVDKEPGATATDQPAAARRGQNKNVEKGVNILGHKVHWQIESPPLLVNAMALGAKTLFVAGPPDLADETAMLGYLPGADDAINRELAEQDAAWRGERGGILWAVSAESGDKLAEYKLDGIPVFDGMSLAEGKLFASMTDGSVVCFAGK